MVPREVDAARRGGGGGEWMMRRDGTAVAWDDRSGRDGHEDTIASTATKPPQ